MGKSSTRGSARHSASRSPPRPGGSGDPERWHGNRFRLGEGSSACPRGGGLTLRRNTKWMAVPLGALAAAALWVAFVRLHHASGGAGHAGGSGSSAAGLDVAQANDLAVESWTPRFREHEERGAWAALDADLDVISQQDRDLYQRYRLAYIHARAKIGHGDLAGGRKALEPFLGPGDAFRDLALYYTAQVAQAEGKKGEAAQLRETLVVEFPKGIYRQSALEDLVAFLPDKRDAAALAELSRKVAGTIEPPVQRDLESRVIAARLTGGEEAAIPDGLRFLRGGNLADDAAEGVATALDRLEWINRFSADEHEQRASLRSRYRSPSARPAPAAEQARRPSLLDRPRR